MTIIIHIIRDYWNYKHIMAGDPVSCPLIEPVSCHAMTLIVSCLERLSHGESPSIYSLDLFSYPRYHDQEFFAAMSAR